MLTHVSFVPPQASSFAGEVDALTLWLVGMCTFFTVLIAVMVIYFAVRYRRRHPDEVGSRFDHSTMLEVIWTSIPLLIVLVTFVWGAKVYFRLYRPPTGAKVYYVTGKQWMWKTQHPTGQREINELHLPVGEPVKLTLTSEDVIHSFFVPAFRAKVDVVPGRYTTMWFTPTKPGRYHLFCAEYCGTEHSRMVGWVTVMERGDYERWLASVPVAVTPEEQGGKLFTDLSCQSCHADGNRNGPSLRNLYGTEVKLAGGGRAIADEDYLRESILDPARKVVDGWQAEMPSFRGKVDEQAILNLISYIKGLTGSEPPAKSESAEPQAAVAGSESR